MFTAVRATLRPNAVACKRCFSSLSVQLKQAGGGKIMTPKAAIADIPVGAKVMVGGFGLCGVPRTLLDEVVKRPELKDLDVYSNNLGTPGRGVGLLAREGRVRSITGSFLGGNREFGDQFFRGEVQLNLCPQGTFAERIRAGAAGIPAFYTPTGYGTAVHKGELVLKYEKKEGEEAKPVLISKPRESRRFGNRDFILEEAIYGDYALIHARKADEAGNLIFHSTARNFNDPMARNARVTIAEVEEIVPVGSISSDEVHLPSIFVDRIVKAELPLEVEKVCLSKPEGDATELTKRDIIAKRAAAELSDGMYVNLGVGMPNLVPSYLSKDVDVFVHTENGLLGVGPYPSKEEDVHTDIINAGKESITERPDAAAFDAVASFDIVRGGHLDVTMLGALQVTANGDLANYMIPGKFATGMGGAMDLVSNPDNTRVIVLTEHVDKTGKPKVVQNTELPLTGVRCVSTIITDLAVFNVDREKGGLTLVELQPGVTLEEVKAKTGADFKVAL